jgi:hypothetical protein
VQQILSLHEPVELDVPALEEEWLVDGFLEEAERMFRSWHDFSP